jgi:hypothetical protein
VRALVLLLAGLSAAAANGQAIVTSPGPDRVAVTVYRDPNRGTGEMNLGWLNGIAMVSETRRVSIPAGESELRFEGVTDGMVPQTAIVTGLGDAVLEKNRDARLLSPGALLDAYLAQRVQLRRTSKATGAVREQEAVIRATANGVVVQTAEGFEALRCTGLPETLVAPAVPADLSAKPTLSVRVRSPQPVETDVTLAYLSNNFDWQTDYVAELSEDGKKVSLFGWLTMANGDDTGLASAATQVVAGKVNYQKVWVNRGEASQVQIQCWPSDTTSDVPENEEYIVVTGSRIVAAMAPPPPPPPPPEAERGGDESYMAQEERFGDFRLYRVPIAVTVAANSQKQVAMLRQPAVAIQTIFRLRPHFNQFERPVERILVTRNRKVDGLGLALPAGRVAVFGKSNGRRILIGEGAIDDHAVGEKVEITLGNPTGVTAKQVMFRVPKTMEAGYDLFLTNDLPEPQVVEVELPLRSVPPKGVRFVKRDGWNVWRATVPANGRAWLRWMAGS